jgi:hypothetical protein
VSTFAFRVACACCRQAEKLLAATQQLAKLEKSFAAAQAQAAALDRQKEELKANAIAADTKVRRGSVQ